MATLRQGRTLAVLGYMAELGEHERAGHEQVGRLAAELGVDGLVVIGESVRVADQEAAVAALRERLRPGDVVLVKGSR